MIFKSIFTEISNRYNCEYDVEDITSSGHAMSKHYLTIHHNDVVLNLKYDLGNYNLAEINFSIKTELLIPEIQVETRGYFNRLFSSNKNIWKIQGDNNKLNLDINNILSKNGLTDLAKKEAFEPYIKGEYKDEIFKFHTRYYLGFNNKEASIEPIINFHIEMIDYIKSTFNRYSTLTK